MSLAEQGFCLHKIHAQDQDNQGFSNLSVSFSPGIVYAIMSQTPEELSIFFHLLAGDLKVLSGEVFVNTIPKSFASKDFLYKAIRRVRQVPTNFAHHTAIESVFADTFPFFSNRKMGDYYDMYRAMADKFQCNIPPERIITELSRQDRLMLELMGALISDAEIIILYDTLSSMNSINTLKSQRIIEEMAARGKYILYLSSKLEVSLGISDVLRIIQNGVFLKEYRTEMIINNPEEVIRFLTGVSFGSEVAQDNIDFIQSMIRVREKINSMATFRERIISFAEDIHHTTGGTCHIRLYRDDAVIIEHQTPENTQEGIWGSEYYSQERLSAIIEAGEVVFLQGKAKEKVVIIPVRGDGQTFGFVELVGIGRRTKRTEILYQAIGKELSSIIEFSNLMDKSVMLQEMNHRIKNNLQMVISLLNLFRDSVEQNPDANIYEMIDSTTQRIQSIAVIHDLLAYNQYVGGMVELRKITEKITDFYRPAALIEIDELEDIFVPYNKAASIAMVFNEIINNSIKHAGNRKSVHIAISGRTQGDEVVITCADNGEGMKMPAGSSNEQGVGLKIIHSIVESNSGSFTLYNSAESQGAIAELKLPTAFFHLYPSFADVNT